MYCTTAGMCGASFSSAASSSITSAWQMLQRTSGDWSVASANRPCMNWSMCWVSAGGMSGTKWLMHETPYLRY